ncbi:MAG: MYG1 family protein [Patescibacteria group bacterium]|nr:MYG1 family protein [Patescibacteria group bacterium]
MKTIVTHISPDLDAVTACWLIKRFLPGWQKAQIKLVPAGETLDKISPDEDPEIIHVDTGLGRFDHHQTSAKICAALLVFNHLKEKKFVFGKKLLALERLVQQVNFFDHFGEIKLKNPDLDCYEFLLPIVIDSGLRTLMIKGNELIEYLFPILDSLVITFQKKIEAEREIEKGLQFPSRWGRTLIVLSKNEEVIKLGLRRGFKLVARKDPEIGNIRIKTTPGKKYHLKDLYKKILEIDKNATWFFHASGNMLLNGSTKNPYFVPSSLTIDQLVDIIKKIR